MELRHLRYFMTVAEELHFGRAAEKLHISQPPLSMQIRALERELGVTLLNRTQRHVSLTQAGNTLLQEARQILARLDQAVLMTRRAGRGEIGELAIGFISVADYNILPSLLREFRRRYPLVNLTLRNTTLAKNLELSASVYNLFDYSYAGLGGTEHTQELLPQDGRTFRVKLTYAF